MAAAPKTNKNKTDEATTSAPTTNAAGNTPGTPVPTRSTKPPGTRVQPVTTDASLSGVFAMPIKSSNRGSATLYPFKSLTAVGMSFGVLNKSVKELASVLSNQNSKTVEKRDPVTNLPIYKVMTNPDGTPMVDPITQAPVHTTEIETVPGPQFFAAEVDVNNYPDGTPAEQRCPVRVFRHS